MLADFVVMFVNAASIYINREAPISHDCGDVGTSRVGSNPTNPSEGLAVDIKTTSTYGLHWTPGLGTLIGAYARKPMAARKSLPPSADASKPQVVRRKPVHKQTDPPDSDPGTQSMPLSTLLEWRPDPSIYEQDDDPVQQMVKNLHQDAAAKILQEPSLLLVVRNLILHASQERVDAAVKYIRAHDHGSEPGDNPCGMAWVELIGRLRQGHYAPFVDPVSKLKLDHMMYAGITQTMLLNDGLQTDAQVLSLAPPPNWPINRSFFRVTPIPFTYDEEAYRRDFEYRYWVGERTLGMTDTTTIEAFRKEVEYRHNNREKLAAPFVAPPILDRSEAEYAYDNVLRATHRFRQMQQTIANSNVQLNTTGWPRDPGLIGPYLDMIKGEPAADAFPKLPEMHTGVTGERQAGGGVNILQTERFPMARNWTTLYELARYPMNLPPVDPMEFRYARSPEVLFTDRFGVTMSGASQTVQCSSTSEHEISNRSIADTVGYDHNLASHGITYEDYRRFIVGIINILSANTTSTEWRSKKDALKKFFYDATENLRARGVPVAVKFKFESHSTILWRQSRLSIRHHPLDVPLRGKIGKKLNLG